MINHLRWSHRCTFKKHFFVLHKLLEKKYLHVQSNKPENFTKWLATGLWFSLGTPVFYTNKTDHHDIAEILLKVALNTIKQTYIPEHYKKITNNTRR
jgi:hypothetical protein